MIFMKELVVVVRMKGIGEKLLMFGLLIDNRKSVGRVKVIFVDVMFMFEVMV